MCVDLDGSLTPVDTLYESLVGLARNEPASLLQIPRWLRSGKAALKREVAQRAPVDTAVLPFNQALLHWLRAEKTSGRPLVLATASDRATANAVNAQLDLLFDECVASDGSNNLSGERKRLALVARFGDKGYDYVGNAQADLAVWRSARKAIVVGGPDLVAQTEAVTAVERVFAPNHGRLRIWLRAMRLHQWVKNLLIFVPPMLAHQFTDSGVMMQAMLAFIAFGLCASSVYLFNDLLDLASDRRHPRKHTRPFASGELQARDGVLVGLLLLSLSAALALSINVYFALTLATYYAVTWAYSLRLKRIALIDVMVLAGLYTLRIIAGSAACLIWPSFWLLGFSVFLFLSLGIVKRFAELEDARQAGKSAAHGRGYGAEDLSLLQSLGTASGYSAVVVMALYVNSAASADLYRQPEALWLLCPIMLFWISRIWLYTARGQMHDDPIVFALKDRTSLILAALMALGVLLAL
ncbi:MAG: UbiA family prenyltransferase [Panacagrimonas sp.]